MQQTFAGNGAKCVFSSGFFCAGVVQIKASPKLWTSVLVLVMCSFRGGLMGHTLARPAWPWSSCHVCGRQLVFTARHRGSILLLRLWGVQRALLSVLHLAAACYRTVRPRGHFNLLRFLGREASVLSNSAVCYRQDCSAQGSLPLAVVAVRRFMGITACTLGRRLA